MDRLVRALSPTGAEVRAGRPEGPWAAPGEPLATVVPGDEAAVQATVSAAREFGLALVPRGAGTQDTWGSPSPVPFAVLDTRRLTGVVRYEPGDLTIRVRAGTPLRHVCERLRAHGQTLALHPPGWARATVGGAVAGDAWGPTRLLHGAPRDLILGLRVVDGLARAFSTGGHVVKNVSGLDVGKLLIGCFGSLGVLTEVSCKLRPLPARRVVWSGRLSEPAAAWQAAEAAGALQPAAAILLDGPEAPMLLVVAEGSGVEVEEQLARLRAASGTVSAAAEDLDVADGSGGPAADRALAAALDPCVGAPALCVRCEVPDGQLPALWNAVAGGKVPGVPPPDAQPAQASPRLTAWLGLGVLWYVCARAEPTRMPAVVQGLRGAAESLGGRAVVAAARGADSARVLPWGDPGDLLPWFRRLKERFDPDRVLVPGRFVGGL